MLWVTDALADRAIADLPSCLAPGDVIVFNDTRVIPARLRGQRGEAKIEVTLHRELADGLWRAFARPARRLYGGDTIQFSAEFQAVVEGERHGGEITLRFDRLGNQLRAALKAFGVMPLPPYIKRDPGGNNSDAEDYQTMFAARDGAVAAPTAGLHFTPGLLSALEARGVIPVRLTLHVGAGTFLPVKVADTDRHQMHAEWGEITADAADAVNAARAAGGRVVAVGTTSLRLLETAADREGRLRRFTGETDIFITPGYQFRICDLLVTNFHLPKSTLFMLVCAFAGMERMQAAYRHAIVAGYRFYSYGDCGLLVRETPR